MEAEVALVEALTEREAGAEMVSVVQGVGVGEAEVVGVAQAEWEGLAEAVGVAVAQALGVP